MKIAELPSLKVYQSTLTYCIKVDASTVIFWTSPFVILGVSSLYCCFNSIFDENPVSKQCRS